MENKEEKATSSEKKLARLIKTLKRMHSVLIAYSGGVDSSLLLKIARQVLGDNVLAVTADSLVYPREELRFARMMTAGWAIKHKLIHVALLKNSNFIKNSVDRCYYCKKELFKRLRDIARKSKINFVLDGGNASDSMDFRPGNRAKGEFNVRSPLEECAINKQDIYRLSKFFNLPTKNKPATTCLATRIPFGQAILPKDLKMIQQAEGYIRKLGFKRVRLRHYKLPRLAFIGSNKHLRIITNSNFIKKDGQLKLARIELDRENIHRLTAGSHRLLLVQYLKRLGYDYITLDLNGYYCGSLNKFLP